MAARVSIRELRNEISAIVRRVEAGETLIVTVDRRPVARLAPIPRRRTFVPTAEVIGAMRLRGADRGLLDDLRELLPDTTDDIPLDPA